MGCRGKCDGFAFFIGIIGKVSRKMFIFANYAKEKMTQVIDLFAGIGGFPIIATHSL